MFEYLQSNLLSLVGIAVFLLIAYAIDAIPSIFTNPKPTRFNWRVLVWGLLLQLIFGVLIFRTEMGRSLFLSINDAVNWLIEPAGAGARFTFGPLADMGDNKSLGFILAFTALPLIIFFSTVMAILNYIGFLPVIVRGFAFVFTRLMRISGAESLVAASNIFLGVEASTEVKPYLAKMTRSEFCTILAAGMATVASNVVVIYVGMLQGTFPTIAGHLVSASFLSAPAAIMVSKLILPERGTPETLGTHIKPAPIVREGLFAAVIQGAQTGLQLIFGIVALLIAILGLVAVLDGLLGLINPDWSIQAGLSYVFWLPAFFMGVPFEDISKVAGLLATRMIETEIPSYFQLSHMLREGTISPRAAVIVAYALCGFAHVASMAIFVGGISAIVPDRRRAIGAVAWRGLIAATLACLITGAVAGVFYTDSMGKSILQVKKQPTVNAQDDPAQAVSALLR